MLPQRHAPRDGPTRGAGLTDYRRRVGLVEEIAQHSDFWSAATQHEFLDAVREGRIPAEAFDTWLVQDAQFVTDLLKFQGRLLARAPRKAQSVLAGGAVAAANELDWFERQASARGLDLAAPPLAATADYAALLQRLDAAPYPVAVAALWVMERVYLKSWTHAASGAGPYQEFVEHWTTPEFVDYVEALEALVEQEPDPTMAAQIRTVCDEVLVQERQFWDAALTP